MDDTAEPIVNLPPFGALRPVEAGARVLALIEENRAAILARLARGAPWSWDNLVAPAEERDDRLNRAWAALNHLHAVADNEELRRVYNDCVAKLTDYGTELAQNEDLFRAWSALASGPPHDVLDAAQRKVVDNTLRDFRLSGVELAPQPRARFREIQQRLSLLQTRFEENLLDATQAWTRQVTDARTVHGLPESALALARQNAATRQLGGWLFTLDFPSYQPVLQYADDRELRRAMYEAYVTRASDRGPDAGRFDNGPLMIEILALRREQAALLGFASHAHRSLARKMAQSTGEVLDFLRDLARRSRPMAQRELAELREFAAEHDAPAQLEAWDLPYWAEKLRAARYDFSEEELRPYFAAPRVLEGLFEVTHRLYGMRITERGGVDAWHPDVRCFDVRDADRRLRGVFYVDLYARPHKRGGAWMDECAARRRGSAGTHAPVAFLTCNFTPPVGGAPALLTHDEVITLFHEFGHGLHHLLTRVDYAPVSGINGVPWDAVELPSQFHENWCWQREALDLFARHHASGAPLPAALFDKMQRARHFHNGLQMLRQLEFALFDFELHLAPVVPDNAAIQALLDGVRREIAVIAVPDWNRFQHGFAHIFAGGYAAGYYSYKWAEVLSADAFSKFEENGIFDAGTGREFLRSILECGGTREPLDLFVEFRGRPPSIEPLLRQSGLTP
jgi:oligopeptidase A